MAISEQWVYAQQAVIGSVLIDSRCAGKIIFGVGPEDFVEAYRSIYEAIRDLYTTGKPVDPVTVLDKIGGGPAAWQLLSDLMEITPTAANIDAHIDICRKYSQLHKYQTMGDQVDKIYTELRKYEEEIKRSNTRLDTMFDANGAPMLKYFALEGAPADEYSMAFPDGSELVEVFNTALAELKASGKLDAMIKSWLY